MGMFVEEEVVTWSIFRDSHWEIFQLRWLSAAQPNELLFSIQLLFWQKKQKSYPLSKPSAPVTTSSLLWLLDNVKNLGGASKYQTPPFTLHANVILSSQE